MTTTDNDDLDAVRDAACDAGADGAPVLLVDDSDLDVERIERAFARLGVTRPILRAHDGVEAVERLRIDGDDAPGAAPGLVLLDLNMPRMNGLEVLELCERDASLALPPTLVMSTSAPELEREVEALARHECMLKPPTLPEMIGALAASESVGPLVTCDDIVLVDDDPDVHQLARRLLRRLPRRLVGLDGAEAALRHLPGRRAELLIVDARMPDGDGLGLLERLQGDGTLRSRRTVLSSAGPLGREDQARARSLGVEVIVKRELFDRTGFAAHIERRAMSAAA